MTFSYDKARLQALLDDVDGKAVALERVAAEAAKVQMRGQDLSEKDLAEIERFARSSSAPPALKDLQRKVDAGELSWKDISDGRALGSEEMQRAMRGSMPGLKKAYSAIQEGQNIDEIIASGQSRARRSRGDYDDDTPSDVTEDAF